MALLASNMGLGMFVPDSPVFFGMMIGPPLVFIWFGVIEMCFRE